MKNLVISIHRLISSNRNLPKNVSKFVMFSAIAVLLIFAPGCDETNNGTNVSGEPVHGVLLGNHNEDELIKIILLSDVITTCI